MSSQNYQYLSFITFCIILGLLVLYIFLSVRKLKLYQKNQQQIAKNHYGYEIKSYFRHLYENSVFSYLDPSLNLTQIVIEENSSQQNEQQNLLNELVIHSSELSHQQIQDSQIPLQNTSQDQSLSIPQNQVSRRQNNIQDRSSVIIEEERQTERTDTVADQNIPIQNIQERSELSSSDEEDDDDDDDDYDYDDDGNNANGIKENPKGKKFKHKSFNLFTGYQLFRLYWIMTVFSFPVYSLILLLGEQIDNHIVLMILSVFSILPSFTVIFSVMFFACIVQNQGSFLKLKEDNAQSYFKLNSNDVSDQDSAGGENSGQMRSNNDRNESERKIFVKHSIRRGQITGVTFAFIQIGILIHSFCSGNYDPKYIMINPLLMLIKSINYLHIYITQQLKYSNQKIQTQQIVYQYYNNFYQKYFDFVINLFQLTIHQYYLPLYNSEGLGLQLILKIFQIKLFQKNNQKLQF